MMNEFFLYYIIRPCIKYEIIHCITHGHDTSFFSSLENKMDWIGMINKFSLFFYPKKHILYFIIIKKMLPLLVPTFLNFIVLLFFNSLII